MSRRQMTETLPLDQNKYNTLVIKSRKIILNKGQVEIIERLANCIYAAFPTMSKEKIKTILVLAVREWEMENKRPINDFRFMHVNERMEAFNHILTKFLELLSSVLTQPLDKQTVEFVHKNVLTHYKDLLEAEGYVVTYKF